MTRTIVLLPVSQRTIAEVSAEVTLRGQADRCGWYEGHRTVELGEVVLVADEASMLGLSPEDKRD